nr:MAG TPA: hypothetical protein [Caudoviricetes sp.]
MRSTTKSCSVNFLYTRILRVVLFFFFEPALIYPV